MEYIVCITFTPMILILYLVVFGEYVLPQKWTHLISEPAQASKQTSKQNWIQELLCSVICQIKTIKAILQICSTTQNYTVKILKTSELWERKLKNISYLLSQFRLKYIKMKCNFLSKN